MSIYGDSVLDSIMNMVNPSAAGPAAPAAPAAPAGPGAVMPPNAGPEVPGGSARGWRFGQGAANFMRGWGGKLIGGLAGGQQLATGIGQAVTTGPSVGSALRTGVGAASVFSPQARLVAGGMSLADMAGNLAAPSILSAADRAGDITGPAAKEFVARGGMQPPVAVAAPGDVGRDDTLIDPSAGAASAGPAPIDAATILRRNYAPVRGTGAISVNGGPAEAIDSRGTPGYGATPQVQSPGFTGALLRLKQVSGDNALATARATAAARNLTAQGTYLRGVGAAGVTQASIQLAAEARARGATEEEQSTILHGHATPGDNWKEVVGALPDKTGAITSISGRTGALRKGIPTPAARTATKADFEADMKHLGSREAVLAEYKRRNITPPKE